MALFGQGNKSNFTFFDESLDDFVINEFDAGNDDTDDEDDDIQGLDDSEVGDEGENPGVDTQSGETPDEPVDNTTEDTPNTTDTQSMDDDTEDDIEGMDDSETDNMDDNGDDTGEEPDQTNDNPDDPTADDGTNGGEDDELDTIDDDSDGMSDDGETPDDTGDGSDDDLGGDDSLDSDTSDPHQLLKDLEKEIFDQLSEPEKEMKINELKKLYGLLIDKADSLYKLTQEISKTDDTVKMIDYTLNTLMDLKTYLKDYVISVFDNRTYLQNSVNFQKFLTVFDAIHAIFKEIKKQLESDDKK